MKRGSVVLTCKLIELLGLSHPLKSESHANEHPQNAPSDDIMTPPPWIWLSGASNHHRKTCIMITEALVMMLLHVHANFAKSDPAHKNMLSG